MCGIRDITYIWRKMHHRGDGDALRDRDRGRGRGYALATSAAAVEEDIPQLIRQLQSTSSHCALALLARSRLCNSSA